MKTITKTSLAFIALSVAVLFTGCQQMPYQPYARDVKRKPQTGGVIALKTEHRSEDRAKADEMMKNTCAGRFQVLEEGEVVVGQETTSKTNTDHHEAQRGQEVGSLFGIPVVSGGRNAGSEQSSVSSTVAVKEWQIQYECEKPNVATAQKVKSAKTSSASNQSEASAKK